LQWFDEEELETRFWKLIIKRAYAGDDEVIEIIAKHKTGKVTNIDLWDNGEAVVTQ